MASVCTTILFAILLVTRPILCVDGQVPLLGPGPHLPKCGLSSHGICKVVTVNDLKFLGLPKLSPMVRDYYESGADQEQTLRENVAAFKRYRFRPHVLANVKHRHLWTTLLGQPVSMPVGIAPSALQRMAHRDGEFGTANASAAEGTVMILSTLSSTALEELRVAAPQSILWLQLYVFKNRTITRQLVQRAERAGFKAIVLTVDAPTWGQRIVDERNAFTIPKGIRLGNFLHTPYDHFDSTKGCGLTKYTNDFFDPSLTWDDVSWLKKITRLPLVLKGILTAEDAETAVSRGADAILVSNHGGRQLDGSPATVEVLPEIVAAVRGRAEVYMDGGVRCGNDVIKALALGAKAVFVGRPALWALAYNGARGVKQMLQIFRTEMLRGMALLGRQTVRDIGPRDVVRQEYFWAKCGVQHIP